MRSLQELSTDVFLHGGSVGQQELVNDTGRARPGEARALRTELTITAVADVADTELIRDMPTRVTRLVAFHPCCEAVRFDPSLPRGPPEADDRRACANGLGRHETENESTS